MQLLTETNLWMGSKMICWGLNSSRRERERERREGQREREITTRSLGLYPFHKTVSYYPETDVEKETKKPHPATDFPEWYFAVLSQLCDHTSTKWTTRPGTKSVIRHRTKSVIRQRTKPTIRQTKSFIRPGAKSTIRPKTKSTIRPRGKCVARQVKNHSLDLR